MFHHVCHLFFASGISIRYRAFIQKTWKEQWESQSRDRPSGPKLGGWWFSQPVIDSHGSMDINGICITYLIGGFPRFYMTFQKQLGMEWKNHPN